MNILVFLIFTLIGLIFAAVVISASECMVTKPPQTLKPFFLKKYLWLIFWVICVHQICDLVVLAVTSFYK
jgi:hypothetical protein